MFTQELVPLILYCQRPLAGSAVWLVMAMPARVLALLPLVTVSVASEKAEVNRPLTVLPMASIGRLEVVQVGRGLPVKMKFEVDKAPDLALKAVVPVASFKPQ